MVTSTFELTVNLIGKETQNILADGEYLLYAGLPHALGPGFHKDHKKFVKESLQVTKDSPTSLKLVFNAPSAGFGLAYRTSLIDLPVKDSFRHINPGDLYTVTTTPTGGIDVAVTRQRADTGTEWIDAGIPEFGIDNDILIYPVLYTDILDEDGDSETFDTASMLNATTLGPFVPGTGLISLPQAIDSFSFVTWFEFAKKRTLTNGQTIDLKDMTAEFLVSSWKSAGKNRFTAEVNYNHETAKAQAFSEVSTLLKRRVEAKSDVPGLQPGGLVTQQDIPLTEPPKSEDPNEHPDELRKQIAHLEMKLQQKPDQNGV